MITANEGSRHKAYAEYLGVVDYIRKPFAMERLLEAVNKAFKSTKPEEEEEFGGDVDAE
jgi:DNA-binding NtrC family response regulator